MDYWHRKFICPFFSCDEQKKIWCEGNRSIKFASSKDICYWMDKYCCSFDYEKCGIYKMINKKYEEKQDEEK